MYSFDLEEKLSLTGQQREPVRLAPLTSLTELRQAALMEHLLNPPMPTQSLALVIAARHAQQGITARQQHLLRDSGAVQQAGRVITKEQPSGAAMAPRGAFPQPLVVRPQDTEISDDRVGLKRRRDGTYDGYVYPNPVDVYITSMKDRDILRPALDKMREDTLKLRDSRAALEVSGLKAQMETLKPEEITSAIRAAIALDTQSRHRRSVFSQYRAFFDGYKQPPVIPVTVEAVIAYLAHHVLVKMNMSHVVSDTLSNLRNAAMGMGVWGVNAQGEDELKQFLKYLRDTAPSKHTPCTLVPTKVVVDSCRYLEGLGTLQALQTRAIIIISTCFCVRYTELIGERALRWEDITAHDKGLVVDLSNTKNFSGTLDKEVRVAPHLNKELADICPVRCYLEYRSAFIKAGGTPSGPMFVCFDDEGRLTKETADDEVAQAQVYKEFARAGMNTDGINAHWGRHAGNHLFVTTMKLGEDVAGALGNFAMATTKDYKATHQQKHYSHKTELERLATAERHILTLWGSQCCQGKTVG